MNWFKPAKKVTKLEQEVQELRSLVDSLCAGVAVFGENEDVAVKHGAIKKSAKAQIYGASLARAAEAMRRIGEYNSQAKILTEDYGHLFKEKP